jgi:Ca2+-binding RTX toxin-like protein
MRKTVLLLTSMVLALLLASGVVLAETVNCDFSTSDNPCFGTAVADTLYGTPYADYIYGQGGNDKIYGFEGDDIHLTGEQWDRPSRDGNDRVYGGLGRDSIYWLFGGADVAKGHGGGDFINLVDDDIDLDSGHVFRDTPNPGVDTAYGGGGADHVYAVDGFRDNIDCGLSSFDTVYFDEGIDEITNCETLEPRTLPSP